MTVLKLTTVLLAAAVAAPLMAQTPPPPPSGMEGKSPRVIMMQRHMGGEREGMGRFEGMSEEGRKVLREAMKPQRTDADRDALAAARNRILSLITADRLDVAAIRQAQAAEREVAMKQHARQQEAMVAAYQKLSVADRKAFVANMRAREDRMADAMKKARERLEEMEKRMRDRGASLDDLQMLEPISFAKVQ
jgi:Heavy-metal resistance